MITRMGGLLHPFEAVKVSCKGVSDEFHLQLINFCVCVFIGGSLLQTHIAKSEAFPNRE